MNEIKKLRLNKRVVAELSDKAAHNLRGGLDPAENQTMDSDTIAHDSHVNTCFTKNCC